MTEICAFPDCDVPIRADSATGVCFRHIHRPGFCGCTQCLWGKPIYRVRSRDELVRLGLLPAAPVFRGGRG